MCILSWYPNSFAQLYMFTFTDSVEDAVALLTNFTPNHIKHVRPLAFVHSLLHDVCIHVFVYLIAVMKSSNLHVETESFKCEKKGVRRSAETKDGPHLISAPPLKDDYIILLRLKDLI